MRVVLTKSSLAKILLVFSIFVAVFISYNTFFQVYTLGLFVASFLLRKRWLAWNRYFSLEILFIFYVFIQYLFEITLSPELTGAALRRLVFNLLYEVAVYNLLIALMDEKDKKQIRIVPGEMVDHFSKAYTMAVLLLTFFGLITGEIFSRRFSTDNMDISILGLKLSVGGGTTVGYLAAITFGTLMIMYYGTNLKRYGIFSLIAFAVILLSGTRKVLLLAAVMFVITSVYRKKSVKRFFYILAIIAGAALLFLMIMKIPRLYEVIGARVERVLTGLFQGEIIDHSLNLRHNMRDTAFQMFQSHPVTGCGLNTFTLFYLDGSVVYCHNNYLEILSGTGVIGGVLFFSKFIYLLGCLIGNVRRSKDELKRYYAVSVLGMFLTILVMEYWQVSYHRIQFLLIYVCMLLMCRATARDKYADVEIRDIETEDKKAGKKEQHFKFRRSFDRTGYRVK